MSAEDRERRRRDLSVDGFRRALLDNLYFNRGTSPQTASKWDVYAALATAVRDRMVPYWASTNQVRNHENPRTVYYLSAEYLPGRQLTQNLLYTGTAELSWQALVDLGGSLDEVVQADPEPGLGNGGLGRLASCYLDSLATLDIPAIGYGIRYEFGIFEQRFEDGWQVERPDGWLQQGFPWEFDQPDDVRPVGFGGRTEGYTDDWGHLRFRWVPDERVLGEPFHVFVPGFRTNTVNLLRLWRARASKEFNLQLFDTGDYARAVEAKVYSENISKVLYPNDVTPQGKELRLRQEYFFVTCSLQDIIDRYQRRNPDWRHFPAKVVIQLNDTHPVVAIPELMRVLLDDYHLPWDEAWKITRNSFAYTCHTLLPEALEKWPVELFGRLLPRHLELVYAINEQFLDEVRQAFPGDDARVRRMSIIEEGPVRQVRMAHLAAVGSFAVNGVAELHSRLLREVTLRDFAEMWPDKFTNVTNGVTPRRFIRLANRRLSALINSKLGGEEWLKDLDRLAELEQHVDDPGFRDAFRQVKRDNKADLARIIAERCHVDVDPDSMFDIQVKRLHEYKRQLLNLLRIVAVYLRVKDSPSQDIVPRTFVFGAKAAPGYMMAKHIIKLINSVGAVVNTDSEVGGRLKVAFLPNFNVTLAERIYPAADLSEQISTAGTEASGTGNMKFTLNGALTIGTFDGANIEILERVGEENFFRFGMTVEDVEALRRAGYRPWEVANADPELHRVLDVLRSGRFTGGDPAPVAPVIDALWQHDPFLVLADFRAYMDAQARVDEAWRDHERWTGMAIINVARSGFFSSDRSIRDYLDRIWHAQDLAVPDPEAGSVGVVTRAGAVAPAEHP